jgi:hypothetical protein
MTASGDAKAVARARKQRRKLLVACAQGAVNSINKLKTKTTSALGTFSPRVAGNHNAHWQWKQRPHRL